MPSMVMTPRDRDRLWAAVKHEEAAISALYRSRSLAISSAYFMQGDDAIKAAFSAERKRLDDMEAHHVRAAAIIAGFAPLDPLVSILEASE